MLDLPNSDLAKRVFEALEHKNQVLVTAESCTGGMIAAAITDLAGSSAIFDRGFVTYSNDAKKDHFYVDEDTLAEHGAVSEQTAIEMAKGAIDNSLATIAVSVTGIAGPTGGTEDKPVGLVYIAISTKEGNTVAYKSLFDGDRASIREQTREEAFKLILARLMD